MLKAGQSRGSIVCVNGVIKISVVLNQKVPVVKMIPLISRLHTTHIEAAEGRGRVPW